MKTGRFVLLRVGLFLIAIGCYLGCKTAQPELHRYEFTQTEMGMPFRIVLYAPSEQVGSDAARAAFKRIDELNQILSDYDSDSELSKLSRSSDGGHPVPVGRDLWNVLQRAQQVAERSQGAFDITVGPVVNLWRHARRTHKLPTPERLARARNSVGFSNLRLDPKARTAQLLVPNMRLDLGGIAKGYAVDEGLKTLRAHGVDRALLTGGGDMAASAPPPGKPGWRIELPAPENSGLSNVFVNLKNASLATSGDLFQFVEIDGIRYSHIVDPRTGVPLTHRSLVTVIAQDGMTADSASTTVSVLGPEQGLKFIETLPRADARVFHERQGKIELVQSDRFVKHLVR